MPIALVQSYSAMLPRLQAEEQLAQIEAVQLGSGLVEKDDAVRRTRALEREALGGRRPKAAPASPDQLAAMGIGVRMAGPDTALAGGVMADG